MQSFREIIELWPRREDFAADMEAPLERVHKWYQRDHVPARYDVRLVQLVKGKGREISFQGLAELRAAASSSGEAAA